MADGPKKFLIRTWGEGFVVESTDQEHALVEGIDAITRDGYLLCADELSESEAAELEAS